MAATIYDAPINYLPFLPREEKEGGCGCSKHKDHKHEDCEECQCQEDDDCSCCPPGLVAVFDDKGNNLGCLTPNDAELYAKNTYTCDDGYVKVIKTSDGTFYGCVAAADFIAINAAVNP